MVVAAPVSNSVCPLFDQGCALVSRTRARRTAEVVRAEEDHLDGLGVSSFTLFPDTAVGLTQHLGFSPRWLDHLPFGGASGVIALRRAARAVQTGDADVVACVAGDTNHVEFVPAESRQLLALRARRRLSVRLRRTKCQFCASDLALHAPYGARPEDFGKLCVAQRDNALRFPQALFKKPLTLAEYLDARPIADPLKLFDCVMPCAGAEGFMVLREDQRGVSAFRMRELSAPSSGTMPLPTILSRCVADGRWIAMISLPRPGLGRRRSTVRKPMTTTRDQLPAIRGSRILPRR